MLVWAQFLAILLQNIFRGMVALHYILTKIWRILIFSNGNKSFLFSSVKKDTPHISIAPVLYIHWEWPVILQSLMYFTESTLLFISCNCSQSWLPGETRCWNRETVWKKYKLSSREWLCRSKKAFWISPGNEAGSSTVPGAQGQDGKEEWWWGWRSHPHPLRLLQVGSEHTGYDWEQLQAEPSAALPIHSRWWIWCRRTGRKIYFWREKQLLLKARQWSWTDATWA